MNYIANTAQQQKEMLSRCGCTTVDDLFKDIPSHLRPKSFRIPDGISELQLQQHGQKMARHNNAGITAFLGAGFYDHYIPAAVDALAGRSEFFTAYTPYQPELSQGTLQAIYEYQTDICRLTDLDVSNASLYEGGTALFEACQMAFSATQRNRILVDCGVNPIYRKMLTTYTKNQSYTIEEVDLHQCATNRQKLKKMIDETVACVVVQNPNFFGIIDDYSDVAQLCHSKECLIVQSTYPISLALIKTPGSCGIDIAVGEGQSLGIPLSFGGPYLGFIATTRSLVRKLPGRIVGRTTDGQGREGFVLTMQAREQHIRREKATSNICTNEALCALRAHIYLSLMGTEGLKETAQLCYQKAHYLKKRLQTIPGISIDSTLPTFNEFLITLPMNAQTVVASMVHHGFAAGFPVGRYYPGMDNHLLVAVTEKRTKFEMGHFAEALEYCLCH
ncbi:MAG: aminomethyl-transferring glycine dehydrogenase subunit GcvPA [Chitinivibrionales bacterium]|nr:aminomethyl-transferring glycine dehydrogenase subunit GcvPA [Chitinivibrionales bacterium]